MADSADILGPEADDMTTLLFHTPGGQEAIEGKRRDLERPLPPEEATRVRLERERAETAEKLAKAGMADVGDDILFTDEEIAQMKREEAEAEGNPNGTPFDDPEVLTSIRNAAEARRREQGKK